MMAGTRRREKMRWRLVNRNRRLRSTEEVWGSETSSRKTVTLLVICKVIQIRIFTTLF